MDKKNMPVLELRIALTTSDYERLTRFYCDGLGLEPAAAWSNDGGHAVMLEMGISTEKKAAELPEPLR